MTTSKGTIEKKCCFYASDFHLEMTIVPYINRKIEENKNVIIVTQNNLEETMKVLISRMNIKNKDIICNLDWNNNDIAQAIGKNNLIMIVNGNKEFIDYKNKEIKELLGQEVIELINCYYFDEIKDEMVQIRANYTGVLNNLQKYY